MDHPLRRLREFRRLSMAAFAAEYGISTGRVSQVENGLGTFRAERWAEIVTANREALAHLNISPEELMRGRPVETAEEPITEARP